MPDHKTFVLGDRVKFSSRYSEALADPTTGGEHFLASMRGTIVACDCPEGPSYHDNRTVHVMWDVGRTMGRPDSNRYERCYIDCLLPETVSFEPREVEGLVVPIGSRWRYKADSVFKGSVWRVVCREAAENQYRCLNEETNETAPWVLPDERLFERVEDDIPRKVRRMSITINTTPPTGPSEWVSGVRVDGRIEFGRGRTWQAAVEDGLKRLGVFDDVAVFDPVAQSDLLFSSYGQDEGRPVPKTWLRGLVSRLLKKDLELTDDEMHYALTYGRYLVERSTMATDEEREKHRRTWYPARENWKLTEARSEEMRAMVERDLQKV